tara:strand:- start:18 stop:377 length:360 start_codon:yes stop_codon:yes gene_type:complete
MSDIKDPAAEVAKKKNIGGYDRHFLICTGDKCVSAERGFEVWNYLKMRIKEEGLEPTNFRSKVGCLRICNHGPIAVVYPEGTWYKLVDESAVDAIIESHLKNGNEVESLKIASNPLSIN